jgi:hypothetical protein
MRARIWVAFALLIVFFGSACKSGRPTRKILPEDLNGSQELSQLSWEMADGRPLSGSQNNHPLSKGEWPFYAEEATIEGKPFTVVALPNAQYDTLVWGLIRSYKPFAASVLKMIAAQGIRNVAVDLRQNSNPGYGQAEFLVSNASDEQTQSFGSRQIKILMLWDPNSESRAVALMNELKSTSILTVREIGNGNSLSTKYQKDCFSGTEPGFEQ